VTPVVISVVGQAGGAVGVSLKQVLSNVVG
jgi:hypothetical protein